MGPPAVSTGLVLGPWSGAVSYTHLDGAQSLKPDRFASVIEKGRAIARVIGREM